MTAGELRAFEEEVAKAFEEKRIRGPIHLSVGSEDELIEIFKRIKRTDWVFSTWRSHYHALLHGVPRETVMSEILSGRSMMLHFPQYRFFTSAIVGGILPIACGVASEGERVWCFVGDMTASIGAFHDAEKFASGHDLPITFVVEDNGLATNTPTAKTWGTLHATASRKTIRYSYKREFPHVGSRAFVPF